MSVNSFSSSNASHPPSNLYVFTALTSAMNKCFNSKVGTFGMTGFTITSILVLLPLCIFVLYLGHQQRRSSTAISHSDLFTYHSVVADLFSLIGSALVCCGVHTKLPEMMILGVHFFSISLSAQLFFHILTCVERYLAVVHPITYLSLRKAKGIRIRNITIGCVWPLCLAGTGILSLKDQVLIVTVYFCFSAFTLIVISFCSLSVLCVLIRPGPGEEGGDRKRVDQSKLRAFYTIMAILGVLLVGIGGNIFCNALYNAMQLGETERCGIVLSIFWLSLPSKVVLPLLFLQRAGKLMCCKNNNECG